MIKDLLHELMSLVDKNSSTIPEGDYLSICDTVKTLYTKIHIYDEPVRRVLDWDPSDNDVVEMGWEDEVD
jgi:hypothetical protein